MAQAANSGVVQSIAAPAGAVGDDCTHVSFWDSADAGNFLSWVALANNPSALVLGERLQFAAGALTVTQAAGANESEESARRAVRGWISGGVYVQFHTGNPGAAGTNNVISELNRVQIPQAGWTVT